MANYSAPPSRRWAYDRDNTQVTAWQSNVEGVIDVAAADILKMQDEDADYFDILTTTMLTGQFAYLCFIFPEARQLDDVKLIAETGAGTPGRIDTFDVEYSDDTTNGRDGNWTSVASGLSADEGYVARPNFRDSILAAAAGAARKAYRFKIGVTVTVASVDIVAAHLYGNEAGATDRLSFTDVAGTELAIDLDHEDIARGAADEITFYVKNLSSTKTAQAITLTVEQGPSYGNASSWTLLSDDQVSYAQTLVIGDLASGAVGGPYYLKCGPPTNAALGPLACRITPTVTAWV